MSTFTFKGWISNGDLTWDDQNLRVADYLWIWRKRQVDLQNQIPIVVTINFGAASNEEDLAPLLVKRGPDGRFVKRDCKKAR